MSDLRPTWPVGMYAPGNYTCKCLSCHQNFTGDKRARECPDCVIQSQAAEIERLRVALTFASVVVDQVAQCEDVEPNSLAVAISYINDVLGDPIQPRAALGEKD